jgi:hypothetical protein
LPETTNKVETSKAEKPQKTLPEKTVVPASAREKPALVKEAGIRRPKLAVTNWQKRHVEERRAIVAQPELPEAVQHQPALTSPSAARATGANKLALPEPLAQFKDISDKVSPAVQVELFVEAEHGQTDVAGLIDQEGLIYEEEIYLDNATLEQPEDPFIPADTYLEVDKLIGAESSVDILLADLEEGMQSVEAEYMSDLLLDVLVDFVKADTVDGEQASIRNVRLFKTMSSEAQLPTTHSPEADIFQSFEKELDLYLELLEPAQAEAARELVEILTLAIKDGHELSEETVRQFMGIITEHESSGNPDIEIDELSIDALNSIGTREYEPTEGTSLLSWLTQSIKQTMQRHLILGKYVLRAVG